MPTSPNCFPFVGRVPVIAEFIGALNSVSLNRKILVGLIFIMALVVGCTIFDARSAAKDRIAEIHEQYNDSQFELIYENSHPEMKEHVVFEDLMELLRSGHRTLGLVISTTSQGYEVESELGGRTVAVLDQETIFERGTALESFSFFVEDGKAFLVGYQVRLLTPLIEDEKAALFIRYKSYLLN